MKKGYLIGGAALASVVLAVRLSGPRSGGPAPELAPPRAQPAPAVERAREAPRPEAWPEAQRSPTAAPPEAAPLLQSGDLTFESGDERTPQGQLIFAHHMHFPVDGLGSIIGNVVEVAVDGRSLGPVPLPTQREPGRGLGLGHAARVLRVPVGDPGEPHQVVLQWAQRTGGPRPHVARITLQRAAGPSSQWRLVRHQFAGQGGALQDAPMRGSALGQ